MITALDMRKAELIPPLRDEIPVNPEPRKLLMFV